MWKDLDGIQKINFLKDYNINVIPKYIFGKNYNLNYPEDIYMYKNTEKIILNDKLLNEMKDLVENVKNEVGGIINNNDFKILFRGTFNRIELDLEKDTQSLFHTHPRDDDILYDPPSILDIISFLALNIKSIADMLIDLKNGIEHPSDDILIAQNSIVFTKNEVYICYISHPLLINITKYLIKTNKSLEEILENVELYYSQILYSFNKNLNNDEINKYIKLLSSLGILIKRFNYDKPETYILI